MREGPETLAGFVYALARALRAESGGRYRLAKSRPHLPVLELLSPGQAVHPADIHGNVVRFVVDAETEHETAFVVEVTQLEKGAHYAPHPPLPTLAQALNETASTVPTVHFVPDEGPQLWFGDAQRTIRMDQVDDPAGFPDLNRRDLRIMRALLDTATEFVDAALRRGVTG